MKRLSNAPRDSKLLGPRGRLRRFAAQLALAFIRWVARRAKLITGFLCVCALSTAQAATLERTADGHIVLTVLGEKMEFREKDAGKIILYWPPYPCEERAPLSITLATWLDDPKVADCLNRALPDGFARGEKQSVTLQIFLTLGDGRAIGFGPPFGAGRYVHSDGPIYPGGIKPDELPEPSLLSERVFLWVHHPYYIHDNCSIPDEAAPDKLGYRMLFGLQPGTPPSTGSRYFLSPESRSHSSSRPLCVGCSPMQNSCSVTLQSSDRAVALTFGWDDQNFRGPRPSWKFYDAVGRKIAQSIFIDRRPGDLQ